MQGANRAAHRAVPGHQLDEAAAPMDADEAHVLLHAGAPAVACARQALAASPASTEHGPRSAARCLAAARQCGVAGKQAAERVSNTVWTNGLLSKPTQLLHALC